MTAPRAGAPDSTADEQASRHLAVLINPHAGRGEAKRAAQAVLQHLRQRGAEVRVYMGDSAESTARLAAEALEEEPRALVVVGGDGTLADIVDVVTARMVPLTVVAAGTGNDLARALGLPLGDPVRAAELALTGSARKIDVGEVRTPTAATGFLTIVALGFDAKVSERTNRLRWPRGVARYYLALLIELVRLRPMSFTVSIDGFPSTRTRATLIAIGNTRTYGGGMPVCADADPCDGKLDVVQVVPLSRFRLLRLFPLLLRGTHLERPEVTQRRATSVTVSAPGLVVYADGERIGDTQCTVGIRPGALTVMVPVAEKKFAP